MTKSMRAIFIPVLCGIVAAAIAGLAVAEPVTIRVGRGAAGEEQLWLLKAKPELARNQGSKYVLEITYFPSEIGRAHV